MTFKSDHIIDLTPNEWKSVDGPARYQPILAKPLTAIIWDFIVFVFDCVCMMIWPTMFVALMSFGLLGFNGIIVFKLWLYLGLPGLVIGRIIETHDQIKKEKFNNQSLVSFLSRQARPK